MKAISYARCLGPSKARTPTGQPIMIASNPFDDSVMTPHDAIAQAAARVHGIVPHVPNWAVIGEYEFTPQAKQRYEQNSKYERVYVLEHVAERAMRQHLKIEDSCLDPMKNSWYLVPAPQDNTKEKTK